MAAISVGIVLQPTLSSQIRSDAGDDVTLQSCSKTAAGYPSAEVRIVNNATQDRTYFVTVEFVSGSARYGMDVVIVNDLHPGQSTTQRAVAFVDVPGGSFNCKVTEVNRY